MRLALTYVAWGSLFFVLSIYVLTALPRMFRYIIRQSTTYFLFPLKNNHFSSFTENYLYQHLAERAERAIQKTKDPYPLLARKIERRLRPCYEKIRTRNLTSTDMHFINALFQHTPLQQAGLLLEGNIFLLQGDKALSVLRFFIKTNPSWADKIKVGEDHIEIIDWDAENKETLYDLIHYLRQHAAEVCVNLRAPQDEYAVDERGFLLVPTAQNPSFPPLFSLLSFSIREQRTITLDGVRMPLHAFAMRRSTEKRDGKYVPLKKNVQADGVWMLPCDVCVHAMKCKINRGCDDCEASPSFPHHL